MKEKTHNEICKEIALRYEGNRCNDNYCEGLFDGHSFSKKGCKLHVENDNVWLEGQGCIYFENTTPEELEENLNRWFT